jgi:hypothetical protein
MNKLRILPSAFVCGFLPSGHKEPRVTKLMKWLITLLFLWPAFASAVCSPGQTCVVTSGTVVVSGGPPVPLNFAGRDFSASGVLIDIPGNLPFGLSFSFESDGFVASFLA